MWDSKKIKLQLKPLSVNKCWQGRRFKTKDYNKYEIDVSYLLFKYKGDKIKGEIEIYYDFYLKNYKNTDIDNLIKPLQDILVKNGIIDDDKNIVRTIIQKYKSEENYIEIEIMPLLEYDIKHHIIWLYYRRGAF